MTVRTLARFEEIEPEFRERVTRMVWCAVATVDTHGRPSTRLLHPIWVGQTGWIGTYRNSPKRHHLELNPSISMAYVSDVVKPAYVEATVAWEDDLAVRRRIWDLFRTTPEPVGYDPAPLWVDPDHDSFGLLRIDPWKITLAHMGGDPWQVVWKKDGAT